MSRNRFFLIGLLVLGWVNSVAKPNVVIILSEEGLVSVVRTGKDFELLGQLHLKEKIRVTPALGINNLYLRTESHLWAFGKMSKRP